MSAHASSSTAKKGKSSAEAPKAERGAERVAESQLDAPAGHVALLADPRLEGGDGQRVRLLHQLQRAYGNAHVSRVMASMNTSAVQRQSATCVAPPEEVASTPPEQDADFVAVEARLNSQSQQLKKHPPAEAKVAEAQDAAVPPGNDAASQAKAAQVEKMGAAKPGTFDKAGFIAAVHKAIADTSPKNLDEADNFASSAKASAVKNQVMDKVTKGKEVSAKDVKEKSTQPPDTSKARPKPVSPMGQEKPGPPPVDPGASRAMPAPAPPGQTNLDAGKCETEGMMAEADVTEEQLEKSNEPEFQAAVSAKQEGQVHSSSAPAEFREREREHLHEANSGASDEVTAGLAAMHAKKTATAGLVGGQKGSTKAKDEAKRAEVSGRIEGLFNETKTQVEAILNGLDTKVSDTFTKGEAEARQSFEENHKAEMKKWKDKRYSGLGGWIQWGRDLFKGLPPEAVDIYQRARDLYLKKMNSVVSGIADTVGAELSRAKARITQGRAEINKYVASLPVDLRRFGAQAQKDIGSKFESLESDVDSKQESVVSDLAQKYVESRDKVDEDIKGMQAANRGLWDKAKDAIGGTIQTILKLKDLLLGVLARAAGVVGKIIKDPIGFLGNLVSAVKTGIQNFASNIAEHLKKGLFGWLFGELGKSGVELPKSFDIKEIFGLILQLLGLTVGNIRMRAMKLLGRAGSAILSKVEGSIQLFKILANEGPAGLWELVKDKLTDLKEQILGPIKDFVITKVIVAGVTWLGSMLNPASAFIKACKAIYDIVMFFVNRAGQIGEFVNSVLDSIGAIAAGGVGAAAGLIEKTLGRTLPLVISFLASLLGIGGIGDKIRKVIETVQKPVSKAVDSVIRRGLKAAGPVIRAMKGKVLGLKKWAKGKLSGFRLGLKLTDGSHSLITTPGKRFQILIASRPRRIGEALREELKAAKLEQPRNKTRIAMIEGLREQVEDVGRAGAAKGSSSPVTRRLLTLLKYGLESYATRFKVRELGKLVREENPRIGAAASYKRQAKGGKGRFIREHVVPGALIAALIGVSRENSAFKSFYRRMKTLLWEKKAADYKTSGHPHNDYVAIARAKAERSKGKPFFWSTVVSDRIAVTKDARNWAKSKATDAQIEGVALDELNDLQMMDISFNNGSAGLSNGGKKK